MKAKKLHTDECYVCIISFIRSDLALTLVGPCKSSLSEDHCNITLVLKTTACDAVVCCSLSFQNQMSVETTVGSAEPSAALISSDSRYRLISHINTTR